MITIGSNGVKEWMMSQQSQPARRKPTGFKAIIKLAAAIALSVLGVSTAHASPSCPTFKEARHEAPDRHLWWSPSPDGAHCWGEHRGAHGERVVHRVIRAPILHDRPAATDIVPLPQRRSDTEAPRTTPGFDEAAWWFDSDTTRTELLGGLQLSAAKRRLAMGLSR